MAVVESFYFFIKYGTTLGGKPHFCAQALHVIGLQHIPHAVKLKQKFIHLRKKRLFVEQKQFTPHGVVDACDTGQITEGVTRIACQMRVVGAGHQTDRNAVREL